MVEEGSCAHDGEQAIANEAVARKWANRKQIQRIREQIAAGELPGPLNHALAAKHLISPQQCEQLEEYLHCDRRIGEFQVIRKLGSGAMGDVYLAHHPDNDSPVALKIISRRFADDEQFVKRFTRESEALIHIEHPNVAKAVAHGIHDGLHFLALEYVSGPSIAHMLSDHGALPEAYVLRLMIQVGQGLEHVYDSTKLVHRDLKPENILTVPGMIQSPHGPFRLDDQAKLIDFGLARSFVSDERLTMTGVTMGTPHYMSPEQIRGAQDLDCRSDIYALGATMFHMLTGRTPYAGQSPGAVMTAHLTEAVPDPANLMPELTQPTRQIILTAMEKDPESRFLSYQGFIRACEDALATIDGTDTSGHRLLRKPLFADGRPSEREAEDASPIPGAGIADVDEYAASDSGTALPAVPPGHGAAALAQAQHQRVQLQPLEPRKDDPSRPRIRPSDQLAVQEDHPTGVGIMPWLVLGLAALGLATLLAYRLLLG